MLSFISFQQGKSVWLLVNWCHFVTTIIKKLVIYL